MYVATRVLISFAFATLVCVSGNANAGTKSEFYTSMWRLSGVHGSSAYSKVKKGVSITVDSGAKIADVVQMLVVEKAYSKLVLEHSCHWDAVGADASGYLENGQIKVDLIAVPKDQDQPINEKLKLIHVGEGQMYSHYIGVESDGSIVKHFISMSNNPLTNHAWHGEAFAGAAFTLTPTDCHFTPRTVPTGVAVNNSVPVLPIYYMGRNNNGMLLFKLGPLDEVPSVNNQVVIPAQPGTYALVFDLPIRIVKANGFKVTYVIPNEAPVVQTGTSSSR